MEMFIDIDILFVLKLSLATLVGLIVGRERKRNEKPGGSRTFALVCFGSTLIAIISKTLAETSAIPFDITRMPAYAITGIGFLGGGMIIQTKGKVEGITTASTLWSVVPIGLLIGFGYYSMSIISTIFMYSILESKYFLIRRKRKNVKDKEKDRKISRR